MWNYLGQGFNAISNFILGMTDFQWYVAGALMVVFGLYCMRGYGSRARM